MNRARNRRAMALAAIATLGLAGCRHQSGSDASVTVACEIQPRPPRAGIATVTVKLSDRAGHPLRGASLKLEGDMSHPGMEPVFANAREGVAKSLARSDLVTGFILQWRVLRRCLVVWLRQLIGRGNRMTDA